MELLKNYLIFYHEILNLSIKFEVESRGDFKDLQKSNKPTLSK
jgi:hypothetical protein